MSAEGTELKDEQIPTQEEGIDDEVRGIRSPFLCDESEIV